MSKICFYLIFYVSLCRKQSGGNIYLIIYYININLCQSSVFSKKMVDHFYELLTVCRLGRTILTMMRGWWEEQRRNQGKNYCRGSVKINGYYTPLTPVRTYTRPLHFRRTLQLHCTLSKILVTSRYTVLQNFQQIQTPGTLRNTS